MKKIRQFCILPLALVSVSACFLTETSLIDAGQAVLPMDGDMLVCLRDEDPCLDLKRQADGYFAQSPDDPADTITLRFTPLTQSAGKQVFLAEAELTEDEETGFTYGLARRFSTPNDRGATLEIAPLDCEDADEDMLSQFEAEGGTVEVGKITSCAPVSLTQMKGLVLTMHGKDIAKDAWWVERANEF